jgi:hypothetical protein
LVAMTDAQIDATDAAIGGTTVRLRELLADE